MNNAQRAIGIIRLYPVETLASMELPATREEIVTWLLNEYMQVVDNWIDKKGGTIADIKRVRPEVKSILNKLDRLAE